MKSSKIFIIIILLSSVFIGIWLIKSESNTQNTDNLNLNESNSNIVEENENELVSNIDNKESEEDKNSNTQNNNEEKENVITESNEKKVVDKSYFDDALFIGDSRTVGISEYGNLENATFFANTGMSVYNVKDKAVSVPKIGKVKIEQLLSTRQFKKIYIMLGINELGYDRNNTVLKYKQLIEYLQSKQKNAIIYIQANLHVTSEKSNNDQVFNNKNIDDFNNKISELADNKKIFYIDINEKFDDKTGSLSSNYTQDNIHVYAKYYKEWSEWLKNNAI